MTKYVYQFSEGNGSQRELLGGKGANLAEMTNLGMPVPQGFTVTTEACTRYYDDGKEIAPEIVDEVFANLTKLEEKGYIRKGNSKNRTIEILVPNEYIESISINAKIDESFLQT